MLPAVPSSASYGRRMALVMGYQIAFVQKGSAGETGPLPPDTVSDTVVMTNHVLTDDTPIYAHASEPEVAIDEVDGVPVARMVYWPVMQEVIVGRSALLAAVPNAPVPTRETVICRGGQYDGQTFSSLIGYAMLVVKEHVGLGDAWDYMRTDETTDGMIVFEHLGREPAP